MKVSLLSGAYGNIGDKLIENRCSLLLEHVFGQGSVTVYSRKSIHEYIERINDSDLVAFSGGPIYQKNIGSNFSIQDAMKNEKPLIVIGGGWKGNGRWLNSPYEYNFSPETKELFNRIDSFGGLKQLIPFVFLINEIYKNKNIISIGTKDITKFLKLFIMDILDILYR